MGKYVSCPKCNSKNVGFLNQNRKGFSVGKAIGGSLLMPGAGIMAGFIGKKGKQSWFCYDCNYQFNEK